MTLKRLNSLIPDELKSAIAVCATMISCAFGVGYQAYKIRVELSNTWSIEDMARYNLQLEKLNPTLQSPNAYDIITTRRK